MNLSTRGERTLHYLNVDSSSVELAVRGAYICAADPAALRGHARAAAIPPRHGATVHGLVFTANRVLHSGVDDEHDHLVAAYGVENPVRGSSSR